MSDHPTVEINLDALVLQLYAMQSQINAILAQLGAPLEPGGLGAATGQLPWTGEKQDPATCTHPPEARGDDMSTTGSTAFVCKACDSVIEG